jgi:hypothetical protein
MAHLPRRIQLRRGCRWQLCYGTQLKAGKQSQQPTKQKVYASTVGYSDGCLFAILALVDKMSENPSASSS